MSRHLALPLRLGPGGGFATVAEDSLEEVRQNVRHLLLTRPGDRASSPELGTPDPTGRRAGALQDAIDAALEQEERADLELVESVLDELGEERSTVTVRTRGAS